MVAGQSFSYFVAASVAVCVGACGGNGSEGTQDQGDGGSCPSCPGDASQDGTMGTADTAPGSDGGSGADSAADSGPQDAGIDAPVLPAACNGSVHSTAPAGPTPPAPPALVFPSAFALETVAAISGARELAALPNGDLLVGTSGDHVYLVPNAEAASGNAGAPVSFTSVSDAPVQGVTYVPTTCTIYVGSQHGIYSMSYVDAQQSAASGSPIAHIRTGNPAPGSDGDVHHTTSVAFAGGKLYAGVGSGCNACVEVDPTRATVQEMDANGANMTTRATRFRNAIGLATNPDTGTLWAGGAGQDSLASGHPYEFFDPVTLHAGLADYGWPDCEENHIAYTGGADCSMTVAPRVELPAYSTIIGAAFYSSAQGGAHAFPASYLGGVFLAAHGSWHMTDGTHYNAAPQVVYVPMNGDTPAMAVNWSDPTVQWIPFVSGFELADRITRVGRPTGVAVGAQGSLFVADDDNGLVYRIRPK